MCGERQHRKLLRPHVLVQILTATPKSRGTTFCKLSKTPFGKMRIIKHLFHKVIVNIK